MSGETIGSFRNETNASSADVLNQTTNGGRHIFLFYNIIDIWHKFKLSKTSLIELRIQISFMI